MKGKYMFNGLYQLQPTYAHPPYVDETNPKQEIQECNFLHYRQIIYQALFVIKKIV
jgi:hypothetical protein